MYCSKCGKLLNEDDKFCSKCGELINKSSDNFSTENVVERNEESNYSTFNQNINNSNPYTYVKEKKEKANPVLVIVSFLIPIIGLIIFIVNKNDKKRTANACGVAALIGFIISLILSIVGVGFFFYKMYYRPNDYLNNYYYDDDQDINNFDFFNDEFNNDFFNEFNPFFDDNELNNNGGSGNI